MTIGLPTLTLPALAMAALEIGIVLALAWAFDRVTRSRWRPRMRHAVWTLVALRLALPPGVIRWPGGAIPVPSPDFAGPGAAMAAGLGAPLANWVLAVWVTGMVAIVARWLWRMRVAARRRQPLDADSEAGLRHRLTRLAGQIDLASVPPLSVDPAAATPYVTGLRRPALVLPRDWMRWSPETLDHALGHELMHLRRRDLWAEAAWMVVTALHWFQPLVHVARRRAHETREMCCDADVASRLGPSYRIALIRVVAALAAHGTPAPVIAGRHGWHPAVARLHALERWPSPATRRRRVLAAAGLAVIACLVVPGYVTLVPRAETAVTIERLMDPVTRQELGMGSLHLRYALLGAQRADRDTTASGPPPEHDK